MCDCLDLEPFSSPSIMVSIPIQLLSHTSHTCELALIRPPWSLPLCHLVTPGHFQKMATSFTTRDYSMSLIFRTSNWTSSTPIRTIAFLDILASPRQSRTFVISSIGPRWSPLSPTTSSPAQSAITASPSTTSPLVPITSYQSVNAHGTQSRWTLLRGCLSLMGTIKFWC